MLEHGYTRKIQYVYSIFYIRIHTYIYIYIFIYVPAISIGGRQYKDSSFFRSEEEAGAAASGMKR